MRKLTIVDVLEYDNEDNFFKLSNYILKVGDILFIKGKGRSWSEAVLDFDLYKLTWYFINNSKSPYLIVGNTVKIFIYK